MGLIGRLLLFSFRDFEALLVLVYIFSDPRIWVFADFHQVLWPYCHTTAPVRTRVQVQDYKKAAICYSFA